jgi:hypothetical protein
VTCVATPASSYFVWLGLLSFSFFWSQHDVPQPTTCIFAVYFFIDVKWFGICFFKTCNWPTCFWTTSWTSYEAFQSYFWTSCMLFGNHVELSTCWAGPHSWENCHVPHGQGDLDNLDERRILMYWP